jgi:hypothetical protein
MVLKEYIDKVAQRLQWSATDDKLVIKDFVNKTIRKLFMKYPYPLLSSDYINCVADYTTGTVSVTNGSATVTGVGTTFTSAMVGRKIRIGEEPTNYREYLINSFTNATSIELDEVYAEATASTQNYIIYEDEYTLPSDFWKPYQLITRTIVMHLMNEWQFNEQMPYPSRTNGGDPYFATIPSSKVDTSYSYAGVVSVKSDSASDTTQTVTVHGTDSTGITSETLTLNGTTAVNGSTTFATITSVVLSANCAGRVTVHEGTGASGTTITTLFPKDLEKSTITQTMIVRIFPLPKDVYPIRVLYFKRIPTLEGDSDPLIELDSSWDDIIIDGAYAEGLYYNNDENLARAREARFYADLNKKARWDKQNDRRGQQESFSFKPRVHFEFPDYLNRGWRSMRRYY